MSHRWHFLMSGCLLPAKIIWEQLFSAFNDCMFSFIELILTELSVHFRSVAQSCPTLCDPMNCSTPGLPVHHRLPELAQTHVHGVSDALQPSHPLPSPSTFNLCLQPFPASGSFPMSQFFASGGQLLELQHQSFQSIFRTDFL